MTATDLLKIHNDHVKMQVKKQQKAELQSSNNANGADEVILIAD